MPIAYFDCFSGVAGDMVLACFIDAGMPLRYLVSQLKPLRAGGYALRLVKQKGGLRGKNIRVDISQGLPFDDYQGIDRLIAKSPLKKNVKDLSREIFLCLAKAEARVHGVGVKRVHFHEVGALDSVVDIVGAAIGLDYFGFDAVYSSPLPMSRGRVKCAHGTFPVPAPATLEILKGVPLEKTPVKEEIVTPTGAAILKTVVQKFGDCPLQVVKKVGLGFGDKKIPGIPNALRLLIGEGFPVVVIEADIDDMNPQVFEYAVERIFKTGARDVCLIPVQMKKNRPAVRLSVLAPWDKKDAVIETILKETTTFGVRYFPVERKMLSRKIIEKKTRIGRVRFKLGIDGKGHIVKSVPEYEDVKKLARKTKTPLVEVYRKLLTIR